MTEGFGDLPKVLQTSVFHYTKKLVTRVNVKAYFSGGSVMAYVSVNGNLTNPGDWEPIGYLTSGVTTAYTLTITGGYVYLRFIADPDVVIYELQGAAGDHLAPAIYCEVVENTSVSA